MVFFRGFRWAVPHTFAGALFLCRFEKGDILYDSEKVYDRTWGEAKRHIRNYFQVLSPGRMTGSERGNDDGVFENNWSKKASIKLYKICGERSIVETTQGRLYTALWSGDLSVLRFEVEEPEIPLKVGGALNRLKTNQKKMSPPSEAENTFVMPQDLSNASSKEKLIKIKRVLRDACSNPFTLDPADTGMENHSDIAPTVQFAYFPTNLNASHLEKLIKSAIYEPFGNHTEKKGKDRFQLHRHGIII